MASYTEIRDDLQTGDIILFSGNGIFSAGIKRYTHSDWSHVGMVLRLEEWKMVLLWESTVRGIKDIKSGSVKNGVQLVALSERLAGYNGEFAVRHLAVERTQAMNQSLMDCRDKLKNKLYEQNMLELIKAAYDGPYGENTEDLSSLFCSELVAEAYQAMGLLKEPAQNGKASNEYTPHDFSSNGPDLGLLLNASLKAEIPITVN